MSGEDQERFEDYLELEQFIEELQAGHAAHPPGELTPSQARIYRMAALFRSVSPGEAEPTPEFAEMLKARLEQELQPDQQQQAPQEVSGPAPRLPFTSKEPGVAGGAKREGRARRVGLSRRNLLTGGAAVAASLAIGAGVEHVIDQSGVKSPSPPTAQVDIVPVDVASTWVLVTTVAELGDKAVKFVTENMIGYVILNDGDTTDASDAADKGKIIAMSAACTHMGCIVNWSAADRKFHCPCHNGVFTEYGKADQWNGTTRYLTPLPRLDVKVENEKIYVRVPASTHEA